VPAGVGARATERSTDQRGVRGLRRWTRGGAGRGPGQRAGV